MEKTTTGIGENSQAKVLHLNLKKKWFDMIQTGNKKEEYRALKPYWFRRLFYDWFEPRDYDFVKFRNGCSPLGDVMIFECKCIKMAMPKDQWTDKPGIVCYVIKLGEKVFESFGGGHA